MAEGDSVGFLSTDSEWPSLNKSTQNQRVSGKEKQNNAGVSNLQRVEASAKSDSRAPEMDFTEDTIEKKTSFSPAPDLKMCTVVDFHPIKMILHCRDQCVVWLDCLSSMADIEDDFVGETADAEWDDNVSAAHWVSRKGCRWLRKDSTVPKVRKTLKEKQFRSQSVHRRTRVPEKKLLVKRDIRSRNSSREMCFAEVRASKKANTEKKLETSGRQRRGPPQNYTFSQTNTKLERTVARPESTKHKDGKQQPERTVKTPESTKHVLHENEVDQYATSKEEQELLRVLAIMQHRDLRPEDYDLLIRLDESVSPKTVDKEFIENLRTRVLTNADIGDIMNHFAGARCTVCMELYYADQVVKWLPCDHVFHSDCIDKWLSKSSSICPVDGLKVLT